MFYITALVIWSIFTYKAFFCYAGSVGDKQYGNNDGYFYVFTTDGKLQIVDPISSSIRKTITFDSSSITWGEAVYMRDQSQLKHYAFITDTRYNRTIVVDTDSQSILSRINMTDVSVHLYALSSRDEVWTQLETLGAFSVLHMSDVRYRSSAGISSTITSDSHMELMYDPNIENIAFASNLEAGVLYTINLNTRSTSAININQDPIFSVPCDGTHAMAISPANYRLYFECVDPISCSESSCTGTLWSLDTNTLSVTSRYTSQNLTASKGYSYGIHGSPYASPSGMFIIIPDTVNSMLFIIRASDDSVLEVPIPTHKPGTVQFVAKDKSVIFGSDSAPLNYLAVIALEEETASSGVAVIDLADINRAFSAGMKTLPFKAIVYISVGAGRLDRAMERGGDYIMTPVFDNNPSINRTKSVAIINIKTKSIRNIGISNSAVILWVPIFTDELSSLLSTTQSDVLALRSIKYSLTKKQAHDALVLGSLAFLMALGAIVGLIHLCNKLLNATNRFNDSASLV